MKNKIMEKELLNEADVINYMNDYVYVHLNLALIAAAHLSDDLYYDIYNYYLNTKLKEIEISFEKKILELESKILFNELGVKINKVD